jgi:hypothetical protein
MGRIMADNDNQDAENEPQRSFVVTDFSVRDIPVAVVAYVIISAACVALGLAVESLGSFWRGFLFGIAVAMAAVVGLSQIVSARCDKT